MKRFRHSFLWLALFWMASACNEHTVYHTFQALPNRGWGKGDTLVFRVPLTDSLIPLRLYAEVRNLNQYDYRELYLFMTHNLKDPAAWETDTLKLILADKDGQWLGYGAGNLYQTDFPISSIHIQHPDTFTIKVSHGMKNETLKGIQDVGIRIEK